MTQTMTIQPEPKVYTFGRAAGRKVDFSEAGLRTAVVAVDKHLRQIKDDQWVDFATLTRSLRDALLADLERDIHEFKLKGMSLTDATLRVARLRPHAFRLSRLPEVYDNDKAATLSMEDVQP